MRNQYMQDISKQAQGLSELIAAGERAKQAQQADMEKERFSKQAAAEQLKQSGQQHQEAQKLASQLESEETLRNMGLAEQARNNPANRNIGSVNFTGSGGVSYGYHDPNQNKLMQLTPAQTESEKSAGKAITEYEVKGGKPALEKNIQSLTEGAAELGGPGAGAPGVKRRDFYDRIVGGLSSKVGLQGLLAPAEKGRMDKVRNTALAIAKQTDPNPSTKQFEEIIQQVYDPAATDEENLGRVQRFLVEQKEKSNQIERAAKQYHKTGYASIGIGQPAQQEPAVNQNSQSELQQLIKMQQELLKKKQGK